MSAASTISKTSCATPAHCASARIDPKRLATLQARVALAGGELHLIDADDGRLELVVTRGPLTKPFRSEASLDAWLVAESTEVST